MAKARAIIKRLKAVRNVRKITRTMELVATARFKKAMDRATEAAAYTKKMAEMSPISPGHCRRPPRRGLYASAAAVARAEKSRHSAGADVNRGLCGGYNGGILRLAQQNMREAKAAPSTWKSPASRHQLLQVQKLPMAQSHTNLKTSRRLPMTSILGQTLQRSFITGQIDRLDVVYTSSNRCRTKAVVETLLPIGRLPTADARAKSEVEYEFLPSPQEILEEIVPASFKARLFKCFLDAAVSEQIARMVAMKSATENADEMIRSIRAQYNRARQSQITSELSEIIGGAAALE
jgi:F-type H+-transporting ATPase subunit gamma